ncbi:hypothetical protein BDZ91DRAFT_793392 [Kalaharituber pfeilii]|nr:hypothetical protein BDZ91DRAFT_793392 [Kalaharituber pfeilii]
MSSDLPTTNPGFSGSSREQSTESEARSSFKWPLDFFKIGGIGGSQGGEPGKRRGPKPDTKPAKNEKLERNRKAQRSHRERKERYIKNLEQEVLRLREIFTILTKEKTVLAQEKSALMQENQELRALLQHHGISYPYPAHEQSTSAPMLDLSHTGAAGKSAAQFPIIQHSQPAQIPAIPPLDPPLEEIQKFTAENYSKIAIDFVLALERTCLSHMHEVCTNAATDPKFIQGHVLMLSCPPESHSLRNPDIPWGSKTVDLEPDAVTQLFNMQVLDAERQKYLDNLDGELTPMAAWTKITTHPRFRELTVEDFATLANELSTKVNCHGFGAVIEETDMDDALERLFVQKDLEQTTILEGLGI